MSSRAIYTFVVQSVQTEQILLVGRCTTRCSSRVGGGCNSCVIFEFGFRSCNLGSSTIVYALRIPCIRYRTKNSTACRPYSLRSRRAVFSGLVDHVGVRDCSRSSGSHIHGGVPRPGMCTFVDMVETFLCGKALSLRNHESRSVAFTRANFANTGMQQGVTELCTPSMCDD